MDGPRRVLRAMPSAEQPRQTHRRRRRGLGGHSCEATVLQPALFSSGIIHAKVPYAFDAHRIDYWTQMGFERVRLI